MSMREEEVIEVEVVSRLGGLTPPSASRLV